MANNQTEAEITAAMKELTKTLWAYNVEATERFGENSKEADIAYELYVASSQVDITRAIFLHAAKEYEKAKATLEETTERFAVVFGIEEGE